MNDKLQQLYNLYKENGLISIDFNTFASADDNQRKGLYDLGVQQGLFSTTPYDTFSSAFSGGQPQQQYNKFDYKAVPEQPARTVERELMSGLENVVPGFEQSMQQKERVIEEGRVKKKEASALDLSAQQSLVESTAKQQREASSLASQQYEQDVKNMPFIGEGIFKNVYEQIRKEENLPDFVKDQLKNITTEFIFLGEGSLKRQSLGVEQLGVEEAVVPKMNYMFGPLGFAFEESGMTGDYMIVTAPDKSKLEVSLNNRSMEKNRLESEKLKNFIASNSAKIPQIENYAAKYAGSNAKISSKKDVDNAISKVNNEYNILNADAETLSKDINVFESEVNALNSIPEALRSTPEYIEKKKNLDATLLDINKRRQDLINKNSNLEASKTIIDKSVGKYSQMKAQQGTWTGASVSFVGEGVATALTGLASLSSDILTLGGNLVPMSNYTEEMYRKDKKETLSNIREGIKGAIGDPNTSVEWKQLAEESFWGGAYAGLVKSLPAILAPGGWAGRTAAFFGQSTDAVNQEMDKNPAFDNVTTSERLLVSVPIGIANAVLEEVGLRNLISNKGLVNSLVVKGLQKAGVNATETTLSKIIKNDVESMLARGTLTLAGAGLAEAETGALQQMGEYAVKDIYNMAKEKKMFNTPDSLTEYVYDVVRAGAQEAVGGFIMGTPAAAAAAYRKRGFEGMSDDEFRTFEAIANDDKMQSSFIATLKTKVAAGDLTMESAKEELNDYRKSVGLYRSIPTDLSIEAKKEAMNLVREKQVIEESIKDKDEALIKKQKNRIAEINNKLNTLSENAVQEQTTSEVPIQSEAGVGEEMEGGKPKAEPQVTTQEVKEEVVPVLQTRQATASALESLPENERTNITFMQEDGVEVPIMGNEQVLSDLFQQAQATPEEERTDWHNSVIDAVNVSLSDQIEEQSQQKQAANLNESDVITFQANTLEDIPEEFRDSAMEVGPMEVTARKKVLGLPIGKKEVVESRGKAYQFEVPASYVESNKEVFNTLTQLKREGRTEQAATKSKIFDNTAKSVATVFPELGIKTFKSTEEMKNYSQKFGSLSNQILGGEGGVIIYGNDGKPSEILINEEVADATTLPHEVWHGLLFKAFGENEQLFKKFRDDITKTLTDNGYQEIVDQLNEFSSSPEYVESNKQGEEWMVQLGGLLTASGITADNLTPKAKTLLEQIKKIFNDLATEIIGKPIFLEDATAEDVLDFMVTISDRMSRGEDISTFFRDIEQTAATKGESRLSKQIGRKKKEEYAAKLAKERPDLVEQGLTEETISLVEQFGEENSKDGMGNPKLEKLAIHWIGRGNVKLPEDGYKILEAEKLATKNKIDPFAFSNPLDIMEKYQGTIKEKNIDLDKIKEFSNKRTIPGTNVTVYDVDDTKEGQAAVRRVADAHWGKNWNGWCLISRGVDGSLDGNAWDMWSNKYNKTPKKIAFDNGKIISLQASNEKNDTWWDKSDKPFTGVPIREYIKDKKNDKEYTVRATSEAGDVLKTATFTITPELETERNGDGVLVFEKINDKDGKAKTERAWYNNGDVRSNKYFNQAGDGTVFIFFEDNTIAEIDTDYAGTTNIFENKSLDNHKILDADGNVEVEFSTEIDDESSPPTKTTTVSVFDKEGNVVNQGKKEIKYRDFVDASDAASSRVIDKNGVVRKETKYFADSDNSGFYGSPKTKTSFYSDGKKKLQFEKFEYGNAAGNQTETREYDRDGNIIREDFQPVEFNFDLQRTGGGGGTLQEVQKIAQRYNVNNSGFAPAQINEFALDKELRPYGYSAKRAEPEPNGRQRGVYILNPKGRFFNPFKGKFQRIGSGDGTLQESLKTIPGYDLMINNAKKVALRTSRRYAADYDRIMNAVMEYVMNSKVYELADGSQQEQLVRNVRAEYGKKEKAAPSPTKVFELPTVADLFGKIEDVKMITMTELQLLNKQMKDLARGAKDAKMSWMAVSKQVAKQIKELVIAGKISNRQAASVIGRLAMVNMFNQDSIDKFTDYMVKVFNDANYDMKIEKARKKLPRALSNLKKKIGIANAVAPSLVQLFSINPNLIPDSVLETYLELVDMFGSSDSVLNLGDIDLVAEDTKAILDAVDNEVSSAEELALRFEEFDDKVYDEDGKLDYAKTIAKMLDRELIDDEEAEVMRKYKKIIFPKVAPEKKTAAEIEEDKKALVKAIKAVTVDVNRLPTRLERDLAKRLVALLKPELLMKLSVNQLENVSKLIDNINNGYLPRYAMITVEKLNSVQMAANDLETAITDGKALKVSGFIGKIKAAITGKTAELEMIRRSPLAYIDQIFGDFKTKRIFDAVFGMLARGQAAFDTDINKVNQKLDDARNAVSKSLGYDANATLESSYRMMAYMIQLEYESNLGSDQVNPASSFIKATVKRMLNDKTNKFKERDAVLLENILKEYGVDVGVDANGKPIREIDNKKLFKSFNIAERNALKTIREINDGLTEKAQYTASIIRGESITPLNNYVHLPVLHDYDPNERSTGIQNSAAYNNSRRPSTKAKTLEGRTGDVSPINFDAFASAQKGAKATLLDFHLTEPIRTSRKTINETRALMEEKGTLRGSKRDLLNAIESANEEVIRNVLTNNFVTDSFSDAVINEISKQGYRAILASSKRFVAELSSNVGFVLFTDPKAFSQGLKKKTRAIIMSPSAVNVMDNVGSKQTSRLFSGDSLTGRFIDTSILGEASGVRTNKVQGTVKNVSNIIYNKSLKKLKNRFELVADSLISTPDKLVMRPIWFGAFANEFKKQTGAEVDFDKIAANDEAYISKYKEAISKARDAADEKSTLTGASDNPFMGILKGAVTADQSGLTRSFNNFNNFMTRFAIYEFAAARQGIYAAMGDGTLTRKQGAALLAGVITRMTMYTLLSNVLGSLLISAFGDEEDKETEKSFMQKFEQALASTATSLLVGRDFGNTVKLFTNVGVEKINEEYFDFLRNGDYDPYEDYISYSAIPKDKKGHQTDLGDYALMFTGSFTPLAKTIDLGIRKLHEEPKKEGPAIERQKAEIYKRLPIEMLGHMGLIPMYNEVRAVLMSQIYSSLQQEIKASKVSEKERAIEKEKLGKYETRTDMKRYDPELYEKTFGPGSPGYDADKAKKKLAEEKREAKREEKDKYFGYEESYSERVDREDRERIEKIKESPSYDPNAVPTKDLLTRSELKEYFPEEYEKKYGEDSEYYKEKEPEKKEDKLARDKRKAMLDAAYGKSNSKMGGSKLGGGKLSSDKMGGGKLGGSKLGGGK